MLFRPPFFLPWIYPGVQWRVTTADKEIYLTFDDGPIPGTTEWVLDQLHRFRAKASFFCIGDNVRKHPEIFQKVIAGGHTIGNHTFHHVKGWSCSVNEYRKEVQLCEDEFRKHISVGLKSFRPPYGRIKRSQIKALNAYKIIMWDVLSHDYSRHVSPEQCLRGSIQATRPGSIIVFHDSHKAEKNMMYSLPRFLDHFSTLGYQFKAISNS